jgi:diguanylate cyclase (GGDEF)-like protein/PAS domain S-box-containing protein
LRSSAFTRQFFALLGGTLLFIVAIVGTNLWFLADFRENALQNAEDDLARHSLTLGEQTDRSFQAVDLVLSSIGDYLARKGVNDAESYGQRVTDYDTYLFLREKISGLPQIDAVTLIDPNGNLLNFSRSWPIPNVHVVDRDYFKALKADPNLETFISAPVPNRADGTWDIYVARRLNDPNGAFMGLILGAISLQYFENFFGATSFGQGSSISLVRDDGTLLARFPHSGRVGSLTKGGTQRVLKVGGLLRAVSQSNGPVLRSAYALPSYPLSISAIQTEASVLVAWRRTAQVLLGMSAALVLAIVTAALMILRWWRIRERAALELESANLRFDSVLMNMKQGVALFDREDRIVIHNRRFADMYGLSQEEMPRGTGLATIIDLRLAKGSYSDVNAEQHRRRHLAHGASGPDDHRSELEQLSDGRYIQILSKSIPGGGWITTHEDVTERQQAAAQIAHMARHDALTGLANREQFLEYLRAAARREEASFAILLIDLDQFKAVNDTFGHLVGDALLKAVAVRLGESTGPGNIVARLGGDEFAILQRVAESAVALSSRLLTHIREPYQIESQEVKIGLSIGIARASDGMLAPSAIMRCADLALYRAKADGRNCARVFDPAMAEEIQSRRELAIALDAAMTRAQMAVHYQPIVDAASRDVIAMEALARWRHPLRGDIPPNKFIALAEEAGLISRLGVFVLEQACRDASTWPSSIMVSVNASPIQVTRGDLVAAVERALAKTGLPAHRLQIEITESVLLGDNDHNLAVLQKLRAMGVKIVLDDFGTGFSSLSYLNRFPLDKIKIDHSFIERLGEDAGSAAIVAAVTGIAAAFRVVTTAEGVETEEQYRLLRATAIVEMQGYLFGRPMPADAWNFHGRKAMPGAASLSEAVGV